MKKYFIIISLLIINFIVLVNKTSAADTEFGDVGTTFVGMYDHVYHVKEKSSGEIWLQCENGASKCLENCGTGGGGKSDSDNDKDKDPVYTSSSSNESCSYIGRRDPNWSDCVIFDFWDNCNNKCSQTNTWKAVNYTASWTCTTNYKDGVETDHSCTGSCPGNASKPSPVTVIKTSTLPGCTSSPTCGEADGKIYGHLDTDWPTGINFCAVGSTPSTPSFPLVGSGTSWICIQGINSKSCSASRINIPICTEDCGGTDGYCGNGEKDSGEACDDGNKFDGDSCKNNCTLPGDGSESGYCGNGEKDSGEACDDGNNLSGDGCSSTCKNELEEDEGYCGDGKVQTGESCDDGNYVDSDQCNNSCGSGKKICGDGITQSFNDYGFAEECDDGDTNSDNECTNNCTLPHSSQPGELKISATSECDISEPVYANNTDTNTIYARITIEGGLGDTNQDNVINIGTATGFIDLSNNLSDRVNNKGNTSLHFKGLDIIWNPANGDTQLLPIATVTSVTPFISCGNKVSFQLNGRTVVLTDVGYNFKKPFVGKLTSTGDISLGTKLVYNLSAVPKPGFSNYAIGLTTNNISYLGEDITLQDTKLLNYDGDGPREFETRINSSTNAAKINNNPGIQVIMPVISYTMSNGQIVRYYLSTYENGNDNTPIRMTGNVFIGIKIIGGLQGAGKSEFTGQGENISNLYPSNLRTEIRKRAYDYTKNMENGEKFNNVKYVEGEDISISGDLDYETLVVKDGNVIISGNLNPSKNKLGIIVLKDSYDVNNGYSQNGNVIVNSNVEDINAMIYADGGFISANSSGLVYKSDSTDRTYSLQKQLIMNGILFTRNTIGGAQYVGGYYTLPGGSRTLDFDKAMVYDLNYIRRGNDGCIDKSTPADSDCDDSGIGEVSEGFIIKYDSRIQTDPPKLFAK